VREFIRTMVLLTGVFCLAGCATYQEEDVSSLLSRLAQERAQNPELMGDLESAAASDRVALSDLRLDSPEIRAPATPVTSVLTIQPDSILLIKVEQDSKLDGSYPVNEIGAIELGYIGPVILLNKTAQDAADKIKGTLLKRGFKEARVGVEIIRASYDRIRVNGAVVRPGVIKIGSGDTISLNDALLRAGGLRPSARGVNVRVVRGGMAMAVFSWRRGQGEEYSLMTDDGDAHVPNVQLRNLDVIFVFSNVPFHDEVGEKEIYVLGEVKKRGIVRFAGSEPCTLMHLFFKIGAVQPYADLKRIKIVRRSKGEGEQIFIIDARKLMDTGDPDLDMTLENGDRVIVPGRKLFLWGD